MSELNIIQESSDAAAKVLDRPMYSGPKVRDLRGPRPKVRRPRPEVRDPRAETRGPSGSRPENGPEHGMQVRLSIQSFRSEMDLKTSPTRTIKSQ